MGSLTRLTVGLVVLASLGIGVLIGALALAEDSSSGQGTSGEIEIERISLQADAGVANERLVSLGGLTLRGWCHDYGGGAGTYLSVAVETAVDDSVVAVSFSQRKGQQQAAYQFGLSDFDRSYGAWDFLGTNPDNTAGTLNFSRPDGGQVVVTFLADQRTAQGDCVFGGSAVFTP